MFCPKCGSDLEEGEKFCRECGAPISQLLDNNETYSEPSVSSSDSNGNREEVSAAIEDNVLQSQGLTEPDEQPDSDKYDEKVHDHKGIARKAIIIAIISILFLLLAGIGFVKYSGASTLRNEIKLGNKYLQEGKYEEAVLAFQKAIKIEPKSVEARVGLGKAYIGSGKMDLAEKAFKEAISVNAKKPQAYIELAKLYESQGKTNDAIAILEKGYSATGNSSIKKMLDEIKAKLNQKITFEDKEFEKMVRKIINKETGDITAADLKNVRQIDIFGTQLNVRGDMGTIYDQNGKFQYVKYKDNNGKEHTERGSIKSINDIKYFTNLWSFTIEYNDISDISVLSNFTNLRGLELSFNDISDISSLEKLNNLQTLALNNNNISNISPLSGMKELNYLGLDHNQVSDISPLEGHTKLEQLYMSDNRIIDVNPLIGMDKLLYLTLADNQIKNVSPLGKLTNLKTLYIWNNPVTDYSPLNNLKNANISK